MLSTRAKEQLDDVQPLRRRNDLARLDAAPFVPFHAAAAALLVSSADAWWALALTALTHLLVLLAEFWSVRVRAKLLYSTVGAACGHHRCSATGRSPRTLSLCHIRTWALPHSLPSPELLALMRV